jgi:hypothetical protein
MQMKDNRAIFRPVSRDINGIEQELAESQIEPLGSQGNNPFFKEVGQDLQGDLQESLVEPIKGNHPHYKPVTPNSKANGVAETS